MHALVGDHSEPVMSLQLCDGPRVCGLRASTPSVVRYGPKYSRVDRGAWSCRKSSNGQISAARQSISGAPEVSGMKFGIIERIYCFESVRSGPW